MFKAIKKIFTEKPPTMSFPTSFFVDFDEASLDSVVEQITDTSKFCRWANCFPILVASFNKDEIQLGCEGKFFFFLTPLWYKITFTEIAENKSYKAKVTGMIKGTIGGKFVLEKNGVRFYHPFSFRASNWFIHIYYILFIKPCHEPYMYWRYKMFKNYAISETLEKKASEQKYL